MSYLSVGKQQLITVFLAEIVIKAPSISKGECCFQTFERFGMLLPKMQHYIVCIIDVFKTSQVSWGAGARGRTNFTVSSTRQITSLSVKAHGKNTSGFIYFWQKDVLWYMKQFSCETFSVAFCVFDEASLPTSLLSQHSLCRLQCISSPWLVGFFDSVLRCLEKVFL